MNKEQFEKKFNQKLNNLTKINFLKKIKINILIHKIQNEIINSINLKNKNDEFIRFEIKLSEDEYFYYFGNDEDREIIEKYFIEKCFEIGISCDCHFVKYNTKIFDSYYRIIINYNNPKYVKVLEKQYDNL